MVISKLSLELQNIRSLFSETPEMFCILSGPEHRFEFVNQAHIKVLGFDATGKTVREAQPESIEVHGILDDVYKTGVTAKLSEISVTVGNEKRYFDLTYAPKHADDGKIDGILILGNEITSRIIAEQKLEESEAKFKTIADAMPQIVWSTLPDGYHDYYNDRWYEFTGVPYGSTDGEGWNGIFHPEDQDRAWKAWKHSLETGKPYEIEYRLRHHSGEYRWTLGRALPIINDNGDIIRWMGTCTDIDKMKTLQQQLIDTFETMSEGFFFMSKDLVITYANHETQNYLGLTKLQIEGKSVEELFPTQDRTKFVNRYIEVMRTGKPVRFEESLEGHLLSVSAYKTKDGVGVFWRDITEVREEQERRVASEEKLQLALESGQMGFWHYDLITNKITISDSLSKILGHDQKFGDIEKTNEALVHPLDKARLDVAWVKAVNEHKYYSEEYRIIKPDGEVRWLFSNGRAKYDREGKPVSFSGASIDITETKDTEVMLQLALTARDEFLSIASHELKTPLTSLKLQNQSALRMIAKDKDAHLSVKNFTKIFEKNVTQVDRLVRLVDDMLDLSRVQSGKLSYQFSETDINQIIKEVVENFREQYENVGTELGLKLWNKSLKVSVDQERIEQVIVNLLTNGLKYGEQRPVLVSVEKDDDHVLIKISDQGKGLSNENLRKVFLKFERVINANEVSGLGIGLFISKEIVEAHKGTIWVESEIGKGSTFFIRLPLA